MSISYIERKKQSERISQGIKKCRKCKEIKNLSDFYTTKTSKPFLCKKCYRDYQNEYYSKNKKRMREQNRASEFKNIYGITLDEYEKLRQEQKMKCKICGKHEKYCHKGRLFVDHTDQTVRGLLCMNCNSGLGQFKDNIEVLESAILYLRGSDGNC